MAEKITSVERSHWESIRVMKRTLSKGLLFVTAAIALLHAVRFNIAGVSRMPPLARHSAATAKACLRGQFLAGRTPSIFQYVRERGNGTDGIISRECITVSELVSAQ